MKLSFLVPFRDADGTRTPAKDWILARWKAHYPDAEFIVASDDGVDPFNKSMAVNNAARKATGDIFCILDADTWIHDIKNPTDPLANSLRHLVKGAPWVVPAHKSYRLTREASNGILALQPDVDWSAIGFTNKRTVVEQSGAVAGFLHIVPREGFLSVGGMDERFRGWGGEDTSFVRALNAVWGRHQRLHCIVLSLWHDRPRVKGRIWVGQTEEHFAARAALGKRYAAATNSRTKMLELLNR